MAGMRVTKLSVVRGEALILRCEPCDALASRIWREPRRMLTVYAAILRGAQKGARTSG